MKLYTLVILGSIASNLSASAYEGSADEGIDPNGTEITQEDSQQPQTEEAPQQPRSLKSKLFSGAKHFAKGAATGVFSGNNGDSQETGLAGTVGKGLGTLAGRATGINLTPEERAERAEQRRLKQEQRSLSTQHQETGTSHTPSHGTSFLSKLRGGKSKNIPANTAPAHHSTQATEATSPQQKRGTSLLSKLRGGSSQNKSVAAPHAQPHVAAKKPPVKAQKSTKSSMFSLKKSTPSSVKKPPVKSQKKTFSLGSKKTTMTSNLPKAKATSAKASKVGFFSKKRAKK
ncbi:hypothetical protein [Candidatus Odyssella acanthamoebae]|uniref:Uncharacterized protein n=1 Tax=Candidatus Odyssella acanthamoebae TaxID=91604 RepID=A0A077B2C6_9PROT|nr:hypothetical protein [Candidatus Paracaedibacter acanthamoebae]AIK97140.1 hypothetical protein ID47_10980 [Candidatus Paracaedibacter acanthamoebae]